MVGGNGGSSEVYKPYGRWEWGGGGLVRFKNPMVGGNEETREVYKPYGRWE